MTGCSDPLARVVTCRFHGSGLISYQEAMAAVFLEGWIFFILSFFGLRQWLARVMPQSLVMAVGAGIGLFIA